jgi:lipopolysaccharide/colanic/teichoic acid biosynthesis glycosyltransferase
VKPVSGNAEAAPRSPGTAEIDRLAANGAEFEIAVPRLRGVPAQGPSARARRVKRVFDIAGSLVVLALASPILILVAIAIKLDSAGPIVFRQLRVGRNGERFWMLKFRSMVEGAEEQLPSLRALNEADGVFKLANDPRMTRVGRLIRRYYVDELPQIVNVLRGQMSLVGPRPLGVVEDAQIQGRDRQRLDVAPGITGPWQVMGSSRVPLREMVKLDYAYVTSWSLGGDLRILVQTAGSVLRGRGL